jgi:predicted membrane-bound spermidine synthase
VSLETETPNQPESSPPPSSPTPARGDGLAPRPASKGTAASPAPGAVEEPARGWRYAPHVVVFFSAACIMIIELVAGRLIAPHLGSSLYTWTSIIGVILAGMSVGNYVGGRLADKYVPERIVSALFFASAAVCAATLGLNHLFALASPFASLSWPLRVFFTVLAIFTLPALVLGTISPVMAKIALQRSSKVGSTIGSVYAWATVGSIVGTLATGFYLIAWMGALKLVLAVIAGLGLIGLVLLFGRRPALPARAGAPGAAASAAEAEPTDKGWPYTPHVVVFCSAACIMVMELVAGRLIARHLGSSLYTWTSIIGLILAGMSIGNYLGGRFADRWEPKRIVGVLFLLSALVCLSTLPLNHLLSVKDPFSSFRWPMRVFTSVLVVFMLPALALGTISPAMAKMALGRSRKVGATIGSVYAWATVGSIFGTLLTGFWLVAKIGAQGVVLTVALVLAVLGLAMGKRKWVHAIWVVLMAGALFMGKSQSAFAKDWGYTLGLREYEEYLYNRDSDYQYIKVYEEKSSKNKARELRVLALDYLIHGYVDPKDPTHFEYDYERIYRDVARRIATGKSKPSSFFLGGGSYTFPRWALHEWPGSRVEVAELDPLVIDANYAALGLDRKLPIKNYAMDARNAVDDLAKDNRFDLVFGDAFSDLSVPYHLTTVEFLQKLKAHITPDGAYLMNIIDDWKHAYFLSAMTNTLRKVFRTVVVFTTEVDGISAGRETFVVAATDADLKISDWMPNHGGSFSGSAFTAENMKELEQKTKGRVLTDDDCPVENLLAPVVKNRK